MKKKIIYILSIIIFIVLIIPDKVRCRAPGYTCAFEAGDNEIGYVYDIQPWGITLLEYVFKTNLNIQYSKGTEYIKIGQ